MRNPLGSLGNCGFCSSHGVHGGSLQAPVTLTWSHTLEFEKLQSSDEDFKEKR